MDNATTKFVVVVVLTLGFVCVLHKNALATSVMKFCFYFYEMCLGLFWSLQLEGFIVLGGEGGRGRGGVGGSWLVLVNKFVW